MQKITTAIVGQSTDQQKKHKTLLTKLLSPKKLHSRKELKVKRTVIPLAKKASKKKLPKKKPSSPIDADVSDEPPIK